MTADRTADAAMSSSLGQFRKEKTGTESTRLPPKSIAIDGDVTMRSKTMERHKDIVWLVYFADVYYAMLIRILLTVFLEDKVSVFR